MLEYAAMNGTKYTNIAFYHFFRIRGFVETSRKKLKRKCLELNLKGTILIAREGINGSIAGAPEQIKEMQAFLQSFTGHPNLPFKESFSDYIPFKRMLVKHKSVVIPMDDSEIDPAKFSAPRMSPEELKTWYDHKKDFIILDTRNHFEYAIGTFENAQEFNIKNFRDFEHKLDEAPKDWKNKPIVTFCTGGIRCEKAAPLMLKHGFKEVYQLDGGILNYFEQVGGENYKGDCFVFDGRIALNSKLEETDVVECFNCRHPVTPEEQKLPTYIYEQSCPYCLGKEVEDKKSLPCLPE